MFVFPENVSLVKKKKKGNFHSVAQLENKLKFGIKISGSSVKSSNI